MGNHFEVSKVSEDVFDYDVSKHSSTLEDDIDSDLCEDEKYEFETKKIIEWTIKDIHEWLREINLSSLKEKLWEIDTGQKLIDLNIEKLFQNDCDCDDSNQKILSIYIKHLNECMSSSDIDEGEEYFSMNFHKVFQKMIKNLSDVNDYSTDRLESHCAILSDWKKIKKYLFDYWKPDTEEKKIVIKILILENNYKLKEYFYSRKIVNLANVNIEPVVEKEFGKMKIALIIGPFFLEFDKKQLIEPKVIEFSLGGSININSDPLILELDSEDICNENTKEKKWVIMIDNYFEVVKVKLAKVIERWNTKYFFKEKPEDEFDGNCADFVLYLFKRIKVDLLKVELDSYDNYLSEIKENGNGEMYFIPSERFIDIFKLKLYSKFSEWEKDLDGKYKIKFKTHSELDDFLFHCYSKNRIAKKNFEVEFKLLKAFDRAYWFRYLCFDNTDEDEVYKPAEEANGRSFGRKQSECTCGCPFADPREEMFSSKCSW